MSAGIVKGVHFLMKKNKITEIDGWGTITSANTVDVALNDGETKTVSFDKLIVAAGATTRMLPGVEVSKNVVTYEEQILDENLPGSIIIAGSGAIGVEFAYVMKNFGVDVTIVEFLDRMVPTEDADVSKELAKHYKKLGVKVMLGTKVESVEDTGSGVKVTVTPAKGGDSQVLEADRLLSAIGFAPRTQATASSPSAFSSPSAAPSRSTSTAAPTSRTSTPSVTAPPSSCSPTSPRPRRRRRGAHERRRDHAGRVRLHPARDLLPPADRLLRLQRGAGEGEGVRRQDGDLPLHRQRQGHGPGRRGRLRQGRRGRRAQRDPRRHMIGPDVTELLPVLTLAQKWDLTADEVARNVFAHPTLSEAVKEAVEGIAGHMINL